jgi:hypothetical protein
MPLLKWLEEWISSVFSSASGYDEHWEGNLNTLLCASSSSESDEREEEDDSSASGTDALEEGDQVPMLCAPDFSSGFRTQEEMHK